MPETVARIYEVKYFGRFIEVCYIQWQHAYGRGEARRECKEMNQESIVKAYEEAHGQTQTDLSRSRGSPVFHKIFQTTPTCKGCIEATDT